MEEKNNDILVLCSGGFDSSCMVKVMDKNLDERLTFHLMHINHGQQAARQEEEAIFHLMESLEHRCSLVSYEMQPMFWTSGKFYTMNPDTPISERYLESRNLVFLSYALSYAEAHKIKVVYCAFMKPPEDKEEAYIDASKQFISWINSYSKLMGIDVEAPFSNCTKNDLKFKAKRYELERNMYHSCDSPVDGKPCGKCFDCQELIPVEDYAYGESKRVMD